MTDDVVTITDLDAPAPAAAAPAPADPDVAVVAAGDEEDKLPKLAHLNDDGSVTLTLASPVVLRWKKSSDATVNEEPAIASLVMRRLTGADVRSIMSSGMGDTYLVKLTGACVRNSPGIKQSLWPQIFDRLDGSDAQSAILVAQHFLANGPKTPGG